MPEIVRLPLPERHQLAPGLYIEPVTVDDAPELFDIVAKNEVHLKKHMGWLNDFSEEDALRACQGIEKLCKIGHGNTYKIVHENEYSGHVGIKWQRDGNHEMFYWLIGDKQGFGLASRSAGLVRDIAFDAGVPEISLRISRKNRPSQAVAEKIGAKRLPVGMAGTIGRVILPSSMAAYYPERWNIGRGSANA